MALPPIFGFSEITNMLFRLLILLGTTALVNADASSYTQTACFTAVGKSSVSPVPSSTSTWSKTFSFSFKTTTTKTSTVTPSRATSTISAYTTTTISKTVYQTTDTFSTTTTTYSTTTPYFVITPTTTETDIITYTSRNTVSGTSPSGFVPLQSQIAAQNATPMKRDLADAARETIVLPRRPEALALPAAAATTSSNKAISYGGSAKVYPTSVYCTKLVEVISISKSTVTASSTKTTTLKQSTDTVTSTSTVSSTTTINGGTASTTSTSTITSTITLATSTVTREYGPTSTTTTTTTVIGPSATAYAQCDDSANFLKSINGSAMVGAYGEFGIFYDDTITNPRDCCNACQSFESPRCGASFYKQYNQPDPYSGSVGQCWFAGSPSDNTCSFSQVSSHLIVRADQSANGVETAMNGLCGRWDW